MYDEDVYRRQPDQPLRARRAQQPGVRCQRTVLTLHIQSESPSKEKESNWLPALKDSPFKLALHFMARTRKSAKGRGPARREAREDPSNDFSRLVLK
jgi:hypothetical protein